LIYAHVSKGDKSDHEAGLWFITFANFKILVAYNLISKNLKIKYTKLGILPVVLCRCETWSLTLREEHRLRVFENTVLRRIFGPKREEDG
jgi:hypothetical protein